MRARLTLRPFSLNVETGRMDALYRAAVRRKIAGLLEENNRLRHGKQPREITRYMRLLERLFGRWLERKYPIPDGQLRADEPEVLE